MLQNRVKLIIKLIQSNLPQATTQNAKTEWSLTRIEPQGLFGEEVQGDNLASHAGVFRAGSKTPLKTSA